MERFTTHITFTSGDTHREDPITAFVRYPLLLQRPRLVYRPVPQAPRGESELHFTAGVAHQRSARVR